MIIFRTGSRIRRDHLEPVTNKSHSHSTLRPSLYGIWKPIILNFCLFWPSFSLVLCQTQVVLNFFLLFIFLFDIFLSGSSYPLRHPISFLLGESLRERSGMKLQSTCLICFGESINHSSIPKLHHIPAGSPERRQSERIWAAYLYVSCEKSCFPYYSHPVFEIQ